MKLFCKKNLFFSKLLFFEKILFWNCFFWKKNLFFYFYFFRSRTVARAVQRPSRGPSRYSPTKTRTTASDRISASMLCVGRPLRRNPAASVMKRPATRISHATSTAPSEWRTTGPAAPPPPAAPSTTTSHGNAPWPPWVRRSSTNVYRNSSSPATPWKTWNSCRTPRPGPRRRPTRVFSRKRRRPALVSSILDTINYHCWRWRKSRPVRRRWPCRGTPIRGKRHCTSITLHSINKSTPHLLRQVNYPWETVIPYPRTVCSPIQTHRTMTAALGNDWSIFRSIIWRGVFITWKEVPENCFFLPPRGTACYTVCVYRVLHSVCLPRGTVCVLIFFVLFSSFGRSRFNGGEMEFFPPVFFSRQQNAPPSHCAFVFFSTYNPSLRCCWSRAFSSTGFRLSLLFAFSSRPFFKLFTKYQ